MSSRDHIRCKLYCGIRRIPDVAYQLCCYAGGKRACVHLYRGSPCQRSNLHVKHPPATYRRQLLRPSHADLKTRGRAFVPYEHHRWRGAFRGCVSPLPVWFSGTTSCALILGTVVVAAHWRISVICITITRSLTAARYRHAVLCGTSAGRRPHGTLRHLSMGSVALGTLTAYTLRCPDAGMEAVYACLAAPAVEGPGEPTLVLTRALTHFIYLPYRALPRLRRCVPHSALSMTAGERL